MKNLKRIFVLAMCLVMTATFTACGGEEPMAPKAFKAFSAKAVDSFTAAENSRYALSWDSENYRILMTDKNDGSVWTNIPSSALVPKYDEKGNVINNAVMLESGMMVNYMKESSIEIATANSYTSSLRKKDYKIEKIDNGFKLIYCFEREEFVIPVSYILADDHIEISIDPNEIQEGKNTLISINLAPYFCGIENAQNGYLFVPSGSGALIYAKDNLDASLSYSTSVYGNDLQIYPQDLIQYSIEKNTALPVFGSADASGSRGVFGIITSGAGAATLQVNYANKNIGYTTVYPRFDIRGYQNVTARGMITKESKLYSDEFISEKISVSYYPLNNGNANITGMADIYRDYLVDTYGMKANAEENILNLNILGGAETQKSFLGVPYKSMFASTTTDGVVDILKDIKKTTNTNPNVCLVGFGESGINIGKIAGGYTIHSDMGGKKGVKELSAWCEEQDFSLYVDMDVTAFAKSGDGFSNLFDSAVATNNRATTIKTYNIGNKGVDKNLPTYKLLGRDLIPEAIQKAIKFADKLEISGISLDSLTSTAYSDYSEQKYYSKGSVATQVSQQLANVKKSGKKVMSHGAFDYAATMSDIIYDAPTTSSQSDLFDCDIPFYQIVFKGYVPMTGTAINLSNEPEKAFLNTVQTGLGLLFTLSDEYNEGLHDSYTAFFASEYESNKETVAKMVKEYSNCYKSVCGAKIKGYDIVENNVRKTTFDNGSVIYVNYGDTSYQTADGVVEAKDYLVINNVSGGQS